MAANSFRREGGTSSVVTMARVLAWGPGRFVYIPHWLILLLTAPWPLWWLAKQRKLTRRQRAGLCVQCGYDLRASGDRCPECGTEIRGMGNLPKHPAAKQRA